LDAGEEACGDASQAEARNEPQLATRGDAAAVPASSKAPRVAGGSPSTRRPHRGDYTRLVRAQNRFDCIDLLRDLLSDLFTDHLSDRLTSHAILQKNVCFFSCGVCFEASNRAMPQNMIPASNGVPAAAYDGPELNTGGRLHSMAITFSTLTCGLSVPVPCRASIFEYIEVFYNRVRRHSSLDGMSPEQFEQNG
jgi:hypothetical protein